MDNSNNSLTTVNANEGQSVSVMGGTYRTIISGKETSGAYAVIDMLVPPEGGPGPHAHAAFQESFYILEGEIEVKTETLRYVAKKGSFVNIPPGGMIHSFKNKSGSTAHLLCTVVPAGLEDFFQEVGKPVAAGAFLPPPVLSPEDMSRLEETAEKYGQKLFPPDFLG